MEPECGLCGEPARGAALIEDQPFCHGNRSCYADAKTIMARRSQGTHPGIDVNDFIASLE